MRKADGRFRWFYDGLLDLLYPPVCAFCGGEAANGRLCERCRLKLTATTDGPACRRCAATVGPFSIKEGGCELCRTIRFAFDYVIRLGRYDDDLRTACLRLKGLQGYHLSLALAELLWNRRGEQLSFAQPDVVVPISLHWRRRIARGFNQAVPPAELLAKTLGVPVASNALVRVRATGRQMQLSPTARQTNVRNAFRCRRPRAVAGKTVLLFDDVLTTGATCHQAARVLKQAGASEVVVAVFARGDHVKG